MFFDSIQGAVHQPGAECLGYCIPQCRPHVGESPLLHGNCPDLGYVEIMYVWCLQIEKKKGHKVKGHVFTSIFEVKYRVHVIYVGISEIRNNENITIDTKIKFTACNQSEWSKVIQ